MSEISMVCPFSRKACMECAVYRGRHRYLCFSDRQQGSAERRKGHGKSRVPHPSVEFRALEESVKQRLVLPTFPSTGKYDERRSTPEIKLKVIDVENRTTRTCDFNETKKWNWNDPEMMRVIDGWHVTTMEMLFEIMCCKAEKGYEEVELYEAPRFMLLAGG